MTGSRLIKPDRSEMERPKSGERLLSKDFNSMLQKANEEGTPFPDINYSFLLGDFSGGLHDWNGFPLSRLQGSGEEHAMFDLLGRRLAPGRRKSEFSALPHLPRHRAKPNHVSSSSGSIPCSLCLDLSVLLGSRAKKDRHPDSRPLPKMRRHR
jgi:hypothetical protein